MSTCTYANEYLPRWSVVGVRARKTVDGMYEVWLCSGRPPDGPGATRRLRAGGR
ncbi:hypothetical protein J7I97_16535 [Streptomyces sp. ISL-87]|uniref:hypothetical protein n=1 Tax=unclassified Streptomyces TaxID=2593676 RepID=UPI001BE93003|nr:MULTISPECIES: hypothetical protein [unclassified Streptomyces]MBT2459774.1 hypothetical protein [Streptomyces sp. ISL-86]MBT2609842.1 hypothetical protein [Streptomyces sp. ISL-87]